MKRRMLLMNVVLLGLNAAISHTQASTNARDVKFEAKVKDVALTPRSKTAVTQTNDPELYRKGYIPIGSLLLNWTVVAAEVEVMSAASDDEPGNYLLRDKLRAEIDQALLDRAATAGGDLVRMTDLSITEGTSLPNEKLWCTESRLTSNGRDVMCVAQAYGVKGACTQHHQSRKGEECVAWNVWHDPARSKKVSLAATVWRAEPDLIRGWQEYSYSEYGFSIFAPSKPAFQKDATGDVKYVIKLAANQTIDITIDPKPALLDIGLFRTMGRSLLEARHYSITSDREIEWAGYKGVELEGQGVEASGEQRVKLRYLAIRGKFFSLSHFGSPDPRLLEARDRIFNSLTLLENPPAPTADRSSAPPPTVSPTPTASGNLAPLSPAVTVTPAPGGWQQYSYAEDGFSIVAPRRPELIQDSQGPLVKHDYRIPMMDGDHALLISFTDTRQGDKVEAKRGLPAARDAFLKSLNLKIITEKPIGLLEYPGIEFEARGPQWHTKCRFYILHGTLLSLISLAPANMPVAPETDRIFDSLTLLPGK